MLRLVCAVLAAACLVGPAAAQDKKDATRRLQAANQKLAVEKAALEREKAQLARDKAELTTERDGLKEDAEKFKGAAASNARKLRETSDKLDAATQREEALKAELAKTTADLQESQRNGEQLAKRLANQGETSKFWQAKTEACEVKNVQLLELNQELLERYRTKGWSTSAAESEPFTGIGKVRLENLMEEYKDRMAASRFRAADEVKEKEKAK